MATYTSYKKISNDSVIDGTVTEDKLGTETRHRLCTKWLIGNACRSRMLLLMDSVLMHCECFNLEQVVMEQVLTCNRCHI